MNAWAKPGAECVCIRDTPWISASSLSVVSTGPVKDEYCIVEAVIDSPMHGIGLSFSNHREPDGQFSIYPIQFFRPIVAQAEDVGLFAHHLDRVGEPA